MEGRDIIATATRLPSPPVGGEGLGGILHVTVADVLAYAVMQLHRP